MNCTKYDEAGHSGRVRPGPIPNPEVKPAVAAVLLICESDREAAVLASSFFCYFSAYSPKCIVLTNCLTLYAILSIALKTDARPAGSHACVSMTQQ